MAAVSPTRELGFDVPPVGTRVSALLLIPPSARWLYVLAHGAGAGMRHRFLEHAAADLAARGIATLRYQFPYMEKGRRYPDRAPVLEQTAQAAIAVAMREAPGLRLIAGGKSMGGRMTSAAAANGLLPDVEGLVFLGFPLHAPGRPGTGRAEHLERVSVPMLFVQGTRDGFAELQLLQGVVAALGPRAALHVVEGGDHSFGVLKRSGRSAEEVRAEIADAIARWLEMLPAG